MQAAVEMANEQTKKETGRTMLIAAIVISSFLSLYNSVAMNIAIPAFLTIFDCELKTVQWIMISYTLAMGVVSPAAGYFSDRISSRNLFAGALVGFALAAAVAGVCHNIYQMIFFRVVQGLLAAVFIPCCMTIIYQYVPRRQQATFLSLQSMSLSMGPAIGPVLAGYMLTVGSWQWLFWINTPLALLAAWAVYRSVPYEVHPTGEKLDYLGFLYVILGTVMVLISFNQAEDWGLLSVKFALLLAAGVFFMVIFIRRELSSTFPILNFGVLKYRDYTICLIINSFISMALCLVPFVLAIYFQNILGLTPFESGLLLLIPAFFSIGGTPIAQILYKRMESRVLIIISILLIAVGSFILGQLTLETTMFFVIFWLCVRYLGIGLSSMPIMDVGMKSIPKEITGHGSSLINWCKMMATSLSLSIFTMVLGVRTTHYQTYLPMVEGQLMGINDVFIYSGILLFVATVLGIFVSKGNHSK